MFFTSILLILASGGLTYISVKLYLLFKHYTFLTLLVIAALICIYAIARYFHSFHISTIWGRMEQQELDQVVTVYYDTSGSSFSRMIMTFGGIFIASIIVETYMALLQYNYFSDYQ